MNGKLDLSDCKRLPGTKRAVGSVGRIEKRLILVDALFLGWQRSKFDPKKRLPWSAFLFYDEEGGSWPRAWPCYSGAFTHDFGKVIMCLDPSCSDTKGTDLKKLMEKVGAYLRYAHPTVTVSFADKKLYSILHIQRTDKLIPYDKTMIWPEMFFVKHAVAKRWIADDPKACQALIDAGRVEVAPDEDEGNDVAGVVDNTPIKDERKVCPSVVTDSASTVKLPETSQAASADVCCEAIDGDNESEEVGNNFEGDVDLSPYTSRSFNENEDNRGVADEQPRLNLDDVLGRF